MPTLLGTVCDACGKAGHMLMHITDAGECVPAPYGDWWAVNACSEECLNQIETKLGESAPESGSNGK